MPDHPSGTTLEIEGVFWFRTDGVWYDWRHARVHRKYEPMLLDRIVALQEEVARLQPPTFVYEKDDTGGIITVNPETPR